MDSIDDNTVQMLRHLIGYLTPDQVRDAVETYGDEDIKGALDNIGALRYFKEVFP